jgi:phosphoribosylcarboxyaminoimidazole (NCAIR) mutase
MPSYGLRRVRFVFGSESDVRLLKSLPEVGAHVTYRNEAWVISAVEDDVAGLLVKCERSSPSSEKAAVRLDPGD